MDEQRNSPLFSLPVEIRDLIYRAVLLDGGESQHVKIPAEAYGQELAPKCVRIPCISVPDSDYLYTFEDDSEFRYRLWGCQTLWRHGHLACAHALRAELQSKPAQNPLPSPVPLFRTCRRVYAEACPLFYRLHIVSLKELVHFLTSARRSTLDRIVSITLASELVYLLGSPGMPHWLETACGRLANLRGLQMLKFTLFPDARRPGQELLSLKALELMARIKVKRFEVEAIGVPDAGDEVVEPPTLERPFTLRWLKEPLWMRRLGDLEKSGKKGLEVLRTYT
ncbi:hypothetical protein F4778DRAFT_472682 [Xylariomycetidae sp. FL2044]|nr:hypothetical protein F4778DRAFT_472682 [Xylariomycetidae sp. FL2044]